MIYPLGYKPDQKDARDRPKRFAATATVDKLPPAFDLAVPIEVHNQGVHSSCVGHSIASFWELALRRLNPSFNDRLSAHYVWFWARHLEGTFTKDVGVSLRSGFTALNKFGVCYAAYWPDNESTVRKPPIGQARVMGEALKMPAYERCWDIWDVRRAIYYERQPVVIGVAVYENWFTNTVKYSGDIPEPNGQTYGGHAMCVIGYDAERLHILNSWGEGWGKHGFGTLPNVYAQSLAFDAWTAGNAVLPNK